MLYRAQSLSHKGYTMVAKKCAIGELKHYKAA